MTQTWHADEDTLRAWTAGAAAPVLAASIETHLLRCEECRLRTRALSPDPRTRAYDAGTRWRTASTGPGPADC